VLAPFSSVSVSKKRDNSSLFRHLQVRNREKSDAAQRKSFTQGRLKAVEMVKVFVVSGCDLKRTAASKPRCTNWRLKVRWLETLELFVLNS
jgi:hypothetical protein